MRDWREIRKWLFDMEDRRIAIAAHRGKFSSSVMENTSLAFLLAVEENADMIELDLARTKDGILVGHHDKTMKRLFHLDCRISDYTWEEIRELPVYNYLGEICAERLDSFEEILDNLKDRTMIVLDRCWDDWEEVYRQLARRQMVEQAVFKFYIENEAVFEFAAGHPDCAFVPMVKTTDSLDTVEKLGKRALIPALEILPENPDDAIFSGETFEWIHSRHMKVWCNSLSLAKRLVYGAGYDDLKSLRYGAAGGWGVLADRGVDIIQTDWPYEAQKYLRSIGKGFRHETY